jgi:hypothetical protein
MGDAERINIASKRKGAFPCAESIANAWVIFRKKYYENESNIYEAEIFGNPGVLNSIGRQIETSIFHGDRIEIVNEIRNVRLSNLLNDRGQIKEKTDLEQILPGLSRSEFLRLRSEINWLIRKYKPEWGLKSMAKYKGVHGHDQTGK